MQPDRKVIFYIPLTVAILSMIVFSLAVVFHWMGIAEGVGGGFCEIGHGLIKQPANTFSNLGFVVVGLIIGWSQAHGRFSENSNILTRGKFVSTFYATLAVLLGPGSMAMHATTTRVGGFLDMLSMYLIASFIFSFGLTRLLKLRSLGFVVTFSMILGIQLYVHTLPYAVPFVGFIGSFCFAIVLIAAGVVEITSYLVRKVSIDIRFGFASILVMALAFFIWNMSLTDAPWCDPSSLIQGHGIWHILCAFAVYLMYRFYVSENKEG